MNVGFFIDCDTFEAHYAEIFMMNMEIVALCHLPHVARGHSTREKDTGKGIRERILKISSRAKVPGSDKISILVLDGSNNYVKVNDTRDSSGMSCIIHQKATYVVDARIKILCSLSALLEHWPLGDGSLNQLFFSQRCQTF